MQAADVPPENSAALSKFQAENAALRLALYETVKKDMAGKVRIKNCRKCIDTRSFFFFVSSFFVPKEGTYVFHTLNNRSFNSVLRIVLSITSIAIEK